MTVSFITTVLNEASTIGKYLESLADQTRPPDEIVIVDGGSTDRTVEEIVSRRGLFGSLKLLQEDCNIAKGRNLAVEAAEGEIVAMSDAGCVLDRHWLQELIRPLETDPSAEISVGNWRIEETAGFPAFQHWYFVRQGGGTGDRLRRVNPSARSVAVRRRVWLEMKGHPEFLYAGEDTLFNLKCRIYGKKFVFTQNAMCVWMMHRQISKFGAQVYNYARAGGRLARRSDLASLVYNIRNYGVYALCALVVVLASWWGGLLGLAGAFLAACVLVVSVSRHKGADFRSARQFGFGMYHALCAICLTFYADWQMLCGHLAGLGDRRNQDFDTWVLEYVAATARGEGVHSLEMPKQRAAS